MSTVSKSKLKWSTVSSRKVQFRLAVKVLSEDRDKMTVKEWTEFKRKTEAALYKRYTEDLKRLIKDAIKPQKDDVAILVDLEQI